MAVQAVQQATDEVKRWSFDHVTEGFFGGIFGEKTSVWKLEDGHVGYTRVLSCLHEC